MWMPVVQRCKYGAGKIFHTTKLYLIWLFAAHGTCVTLLSVSPKTNVLGLLSNNLETVSEKNELILYSQNPDSFCPLLVS